MACWAPPWAATWPRTIAAPAQPWALWQPLSSCRVVIIGDTPKDVAAAKGIGAECIGVGTGAFRPAELLACGADHAFEHLDSPDALEALLGA